MNPAEEARKKAMMREAEKAGRTPLDDPTERQPEPTQTEEFERRRGESRTESMERHAQVASPMGNPTLDPMTSIWDVAYMAGYGGPSQDALQGADKLVTGEADAMKCLAAPSATEGSACQLADNESIFSDDNGHGDMSVFGGSDREWSDDWTEDL
jgi:hypothetical protein